MGHKKSNHKNELIKLFVIGSAMKEWLHIDWGHGAYPLYKSYYYKALQEIVSFNPSFMDNKYIKNLSTYNSSTYDKLYDDWQHIVFSAAWIADSEEEIERVIPAALAAMGMKGDMYKCSLICALAMYKARNGATKRELYDYVCTEYKKRLKKSRWGEFNYSSGNMPVRIIDNVNGIALQCIKDLLKFFEYDGLTSFDNSFKSENLIFRGLLMAYYGVDSKWVQNYLFNMFPSDVYFEFAKEYMCLFDEVFKHHKVSLKNQSDDEQWLKEYYEKCANREHTKLDEPKAILDISDIIDPEWLTALTASLALMLAIFVILCLLLNIKKLIAVAGILLFIYLFNFLRGDCSGWSVCLYIILMVFGAMCRGSVINCIGVTLFFMMFVWRGEE